MGGAYPGHLPRLSMAMACPNQIPIGCHGKGMGSQSGLLWVGHGRSKMHSLLVAILDQDWQPVNATAIDIISFQRGMCWGSQHKAWFATFSFVLDKYGLDNQGKKIA